MNKILVIGILGLMICGGVYLVHINNSEKDNPIEFYRENQLPTPKKIIYVPLDCMINQTHYNIKCYEDSLDGNS